MNIRALLAAVVVLLGGCSHTYPYRISNEGCACREFVSADSTHHVTYRYSARYTVGGGIRTEIDLVILNTGPDTLWLADAFVKIASRNIPYPENDRYLRVGVRFVPPHGQRTLTMKGEYALQNGEDPWLRVAGEEVTVMMEGQTMNGGRLAKQEVQLVPENPYLAQ